MEKQNTEIYTNLYVSQNLKYVISGPLQKKALLTPGQDSGP